MKKTLLYFTVVSIVVSCSNTQKKNERSIDKPVVTLPEMEVDKSPDNWGGDITLHIQETEKPSSEITIYKILSDYRGTPVGFDLIVKRPAKRNMFVSNGVTFRSTGETSSNFLSALAEVYGLKQGKLVFIDSLTVAYTDLTVGIDTSKPGNWIAAQMKLFFETDEDSYELYLNVNEQENTISLPEKDEEDRKGILEALSKKK